MKIVPINDTFLYVYFPDILPQFNILFLMQKGFKSKIYVMENSMCRIWKSRKRRMYLSQTFVARQHYERVSDIHSSRLISFHEFTTKSISKQSRSIECKHICRKYW